MLGSNPAMDYHPIQGVEEILRVASYFWNRDKLQPESQLAPYVDLTYLPYTGVENGSQTA